MNELTTTRDLNVITSEIRFYKMQTQRAVLEGAIEIGRRLVEAKAQVGHGNWGAYLENEVQFSQSTANNLMRIYEEYGSGQTSLFGGNETIMKLDYTKALRLLALPAAEREEFAEENDLEHKSVREIDELIRQRDEANKKAEELTAQLQQEREAAEGTSLSIAELEDQVAEKTRQVEQLTEDLQKVQDKLTVSKAKVKDLTDNPKVPEATMEKLRKEAEASAGKAALEKAEKKLAKELGTMKKTLEEATQMLEKAKAAEAAALANEQAQRQRAEEAIKQLRMANPQAGAFQALFKQVQTDFDQLMESLSEVEAADPELAGNFKNAIKALLAALEEQIQ